MKIYPAWGSLSQTSIKAQMQPKWSIPFGQAIPIGMTSNPDALQLHASLSTIEQSLQQPAMPEAHLYP